MRVILPEDIWVACPDCRELALQREVVVEHGVENRRVAYLTHDASLHQGAEVFLRIVGFYESYFTLLDDLRAVPPDECRLTHGRLVEIDLGAVMPSACARRTHIVPLAFVRVAGEMREIELAPRPIDGASAMAIISELRAAAEPVAAALNAQYEARDF